MTKITSLVWDDFNREHIKKHNVTIREVEEAVENTGAHNQGYSNRFILIGKSGKRILAVILSKHKSGSFYVVTARDASKKERTILYDKEAK
jgi:uncharacterized DUF497 family protein